MQVLTTARILPKPYFLFQSRRLLVMLCVVAMMLPLFCTKQVKKNFISEWDKAPVSILLCLARELPELNVLVIDIVLIIDCMAGSPMQQ